jgi:hypothetical protein
MNRDYRTLIHLEIDGVISPEDKTRLLRFLETNDEARREYESLMKLSTKLRSSGELEPPQWMKTRILNSLPDYPDTNNHKPESCNRNRERGRKVVNIGEQSLNPLSPFVRNGQLENLPTVF